MLNPDNLGKSNVVEPPRGCDKKLYVVFTFTGYEYTLPLKLSTKMVDAPLDAEIVTFPVDPESDTLLPADSDVTPVLVMIGFCRVPVTETLLPATTFKTPVGKGLIEFQSITYSSHKTSSSITCSVDKVAGDPSGLKKAKFKFLVDF